MNPDSLLSLFRQALTMGSGYLVGKGVITGADATTLVSAMVGIASVSWSVYAHFGMKKVPEGARVVAGMLLLALLCGLASPAGAADQAPPVKRGIVSFNPNPTGFYAGLGASATVADTQFNGAFPASTFAAGTGADIMFGYMISADPASGQFKAIELGGTWRQGGASVACDPLGPCEAQSRYGLWQRFKLGGSLASLTSLLPGGVNPFPIGPAPLTVTPTTHPYISISLHEDFVSAMVGGIGANKIKLAPYAGVGFLQQLGPDQVSDTSLECTLPGTSMAVGLGSVKPGTTCMARQAILF